MSDVDGRVLGARMLRRLAREFDGLAARVESGELAGPDVAGAVEAVMTRSPHEVMWEAELSGPGARS